jgi:integrase
MARGRRPKPSIVYPLQDGRQIGANLKLRGKYLAIVFAHPTEPGKWIELSTGCESISDAQMEGAKIVLKYYSPTIAPNPKTATWETVLAEIESESDLRPRSLESYTSTVGIFRTFCPLSKGPGDVTPEIAKAFRVKYANTPYTRSPQPGATKRTRSAKTIENAIRRLSGLWRKLMPKYVRENVWDTQYVKRPSVPKKVPTIPTEDDVSAFFSWFNGRFPGWDLPRLFLRVKAISGCRLNDLCQVRSDQFNPARQTITIRPDDDKTNRERIIPLPADLSLALDKIKGPTYLWEQYTQDAKKYRPGKRLKAEFTPFIFYNAMKAIFREFMRSGGKLKSHGLRKRAITLMTMATQNVDQTAQAIGIDASTARKYYLDAKRAFDGSDLLKRMASVLQPETDVPPVNKSIK